MTIKKNKSDIISIINGSEYLKCNRYENLVANLITNNLSVLKDKQMVIKNAPNIIVDDLF